MSARLAQDFWDEYLATLPEGVRGRLPASAPPAWGFGDSAEMADELGALVIDGTKTATAGLVWEYEAEGAPLPQPGAYEIVLDGRGEPWCILEYTKVETRPFDEVDGRFAALEGEGDGTLTWWREAHWRYFSRRCAVIAREPDERMPVSCEEFRVVYVRRRSGAPGGPPYGRI
jgi:uncharacterized protein YhfF